MKRSLLFLAILTFSSCGATPATPAFLAMLGQIDVSGPHPDAVSHYPLNTLPQTPAPVSLDSTFQLPLPSHPAPDGTLYDSPSCAGNVHQSQVQAQFMTLPFDRLHIWQRGASLGFVTTRRIEAGSVQTFQYVYATEATTVQGSQLCEAVTETFDLDYEQGWNLVKWTQVGQHVSLTSVVNQRLTWRRP